MAYFDTLFQNLLGRNKDKSSGTGLKPGYYSSCKVPRHTDIHELYTAVSLNWRSASYVRGSAVCVSGLKIFVWGTRVVLGGPRVE